MTPSQVTNEFSVVEIRDVLTPNKLISDRLGGQNTGPGLTKISAEERERERVRHELGHVQ